METGLLIAIAAGCLVVVLAALLFFYFFSSNTDTAQSLRSNITNIVSSQRNPSEMQKTTQQKAASALKVVFKEEGEKNRSSDSRLTLRKRLKYAQWKLPPTVFMACEGVISVISVVLANLCTLNIAMQAVSLLVGPFIMNLLLDNAVKRRFNAFDADFPQFVMSLVGLLKTGINPTAGLEQAADGLEYGSLVKSEVQMMMERLRFGVHEDKSIGSFGEDINHPEIELFVQALLLSRRVGGTLSETLERLAKQMRKRQYFRRAAHSAVAMQRGSIWFIIAIMAFLQTYLYLVSPEMVTGAWKDEFGWQVWQTGVFLIILGIIWVRKVTEIRV